MELSKKKYVFVKIGNKNLKNDKNCPIRAVYNIVDEGNFPYKNDIDNTYYLCMDNCLSCPSINICNNCDLKYKLKV